MTENTLQFVGCESYSGAISNAELDVFFVHGLTGDPYYSWSISKQQEDYWPAWLAKDVPSANFWTIGYSTSLFASALSGNGASIRDQASSLIDLLASRCTSRKRIIFITHSMGGLIVKQMLRRCSDSANSDYRSILSDTKGVCFLGTPHSGAGLASALKWILTKLVSASVGDLTYANQSLLETGSWFNTWAHENAIRVAAYYEVQKTKGFLVVDQVTANPNVLGCEPVAINTDHIGICKASSKDSQLYTSILHFLRAIAPASSTPSPSGGVSVAPSTQTGAVPAASAAETTSELYVDYLYYTTEASHDRRSLAEKLTAAERTHEVREAERKKERFAKSLHRHAAQQASLNSYARLLSDVETRFNRIVLPAIIARQPSSIINGLVQQVIDATILAQRPEMADISASLVESALYYLTGNCHVRWDSPEA